MKEGEKWKDHRGFEMTFKPAEPMPNLSKQLARLIINQCIERGDIDGAEANKKLFKDAS